MFPVYEVIEAEGTNLRTAPSETATVIRAVPAGTLVFRLDNVLYPDAAGIPNIIGPQSFFRVRISANPLIEGFIASQRVLTATGTTTFFLAQTATAISTQCNLDKCCKRLKNKTKKENTCRCGCSGSDNEDTESTLPCKCSEKSDGESASISVEVIKRKVKKNKNNE